MMFRTFCSSDNSDLQYSNTLSQQCIVRVSNIKQVKFVYSSVNRAIIVVTYFVIPVY
jgi:hypothetical protein